MDNWLQVVVTLLTGGGLTILGGFLLERLKRSSEEQKRRTILAQELCIQIIGKARALEALADQIWNEQVISEEMQMAGNTLDGEMVEKATHLKILGFTELGALAEQYAQDAHLLSISSSESEEAWARSYRTYTASKDNFTGRSIATFSAKPVKSPDLQIKNPG